MNDSGGAVRAPGAGRPVLSFFPALRLARNIELGEWIVGVPPPATEWRSDIFRELATALLGSFKSVGFESPALVWHREHGLNGAYPIDGIGVAIQTAVRFALLDSNDQIARNQNAGGSLATSENAALYLQPIDEVDRSISHVRGGALRSTGTLGWHIGEMALPLPDAVLPIDAPVRISQMLAARIFDTVSTRQNPQNRRINIAIEWHAAAMANPSAVTLQQRLIGLKTGFEALVGKSKSRECATKLRGLFHDTTLAHHGLFPWAGCIWSPTERTDLSRTYRENGTTKTVLKSELEDWFTALADARNAIIHDGRMPFDSYSAPPERPLSRYAGHLFWKGERILREAIKCTLGADILLCGLLAKQKRMEEFIALIQDSLSDEVAPTPPSPPTQSDRHVESRALEVLLAELECDTANKVQVTKGFRERRNNDDEPAEEFWIAGFASIETTVTPDEKKVLKEAGAEDKLPEFFEACD